MFFNDKIFTNSNKLFYLQLQQSATPTSDAANFWDEMRWNQELDLHSGHVEAGLDKRDLQYLDTPTDFSRPEIFRAANGEKNNVMTNSPATTNDVNPVRPPTATPEEDSI